MVTRVPPASSTTWQVATALIQSLDWGLGPHQGRPAAPHEMATGANHSGAPRGRRTGTRGDGGDSRVAAPTADLQDLPSSDQTDGRRGEEGEIALHLTMTFHGGRIFSIRRFLFRLTDEAGGMLTLLRVLRAYAGESRDRSDTSAPIFALCPNRVAVPVALVLSFFPALGGSSSSGPGESFCIPKRGLLAVLRNRFTKKAACAPRSAKRVFFVPGSARHPG